MAKKKRLTAQAVDRLFSYLGAYHSTGMIGSSYSLVEAVAFLVVVLAVVSFCSPSDDLVVVVCATPPPNVCTLLS